MMNTAKTYRVALVLLSASTMSITSCASNSYRQKVYDPVETVDTASDYQKLTNDAARAYSTGDLETAESLFASLQAQYPKDSRSVYNLAMLNLQKAYEGLQRFVLIETNADLQKQAEKMLKTLSDIR